MTYAENQAALAASPAGALALTMVVGSRWRTARGTVVTVWMAWTPDLAGWAEAHARANRLALPNALAHNTEIGVSSRERGVERFNVADVAEWSAA